MSSRTVCQLDKRDTAAFVESEHFVSMLEDMVLYQLVGAKKRRK